jgi:predicted metalloprotease with PDZ domain
MPPRWRDDEPMKKTQPIANAIFPKSPGAHPFEVRRTVADPDSEGQRFSLPVWIPGSCRIREFARYIVTIRASCGSRSVRLAKLDKHTWLGAPHRRGRTAS